MGVQQMQFRETMAARAQEQTSNLISQATQNTFKGIEMGMQRKELDHRIENDLFNNMLKKEQFQFEKDTYGDKLNLDQRRVGLAEDQFAYQKQHDEEIDDPYQQALTKNMVEKLAQDKLDAPLVSADRALSLNSKALDVEAKSMEAQMYRDDPTLFKRKAEADINYRNRQATRGTGDEYTREDAMDDFRYFQQALGKEEDKASKIGTDTVITDKMTPRRRAEVEAENAQNAEDRANYMNARKGYMRELNRVNAFLEKLGEIPTGAAGTRGGPSGVSSNAPASGYAAVPYNTEVLSPAQRAAKAAADDAAAKAAKSAGGAKIDYTGDSNSPYYRK